MALAALHPTSNPRPRGTLPRERTKATGQEAALGEASETGLPLPPPGWSLTRSDHGKASSSAPAARPSPTEQTFPSGLEPQPSLRTNSEAS